MDCQETHLRVYEYLDGELTVWKRRAITRLTAGIPRGALDPDAQLVAGPSRSRQFHHV